MSSTIPGLLGVSGYALIAVICCLITLEELGIPMPFAPGDFMLVLAGMTIATAHLNPLVVVLATYVSAVLGAMGGREIFQRLGIAALPRVAALLHAGARVDDLSARLRRGGSATVFFGRITPGLRIVTTYVSGLVGMPRRTFATGLAPAIAVYEGVFLGLGAWLGPTAWATVERYASRPGTMALVVVAVVAAAVAAHVLANQLRRRTAI
jgi:membrane protein DedA with SNARE-associated domain